MTTCLARSPIATLPQIPIAKPDIRLLGVTVGIRPVLASLVSAGLVHPLPPCADEPAGLLVVADWWPDDSAAPALFDRVDKDLAGLPVGIVVVGDDAAQVARNLAVLRQMVRDHGGYVVGLGLGVDAAEAAVDAEGTLVDITLAARLALLVRRLRAMAKVRVILRAA